MNISPENIILLLVIDQTQDFGDISLALFMSGDCTEPSTVDKLRNFRPHAPSVMQAHSHHKTGREIIGSSNDSLAPQTDNFAMSNTLRDRLRFFVFVWQLLCYNETMQQQLNETESYISNVAIPYLINEAWL